MVADNSQWVYFFGAGQADGDPARADLLGGKGAGLAALCRAGFPAPAGFTISAECCRWFEEHGAWPPGLEAEVRAALARLEALVARPFGQGPRPLLVAVRSGAGVSMPGMMDTILNCGLHLGLADAAPRPERFWRDYADHVRMFAASAADLVLAAPSGQPASSGQLAPSGEPAGGLSPRELAEHHLRSFAEQSGRPFPQDPWQALVEAINAVFASWRGERARVYRLRHDIRGLPGTAVNVQMMFPSERSGVLFTANPNNPAAGEMVLEASWGLGEVVVSGAVTPDIYILDADTLYVKSVTPGDRPGGEAALDLEQIREIGTLGQRVEKHFGVPCDIEWGWADGQVALLQSRAIRGLDVLQDVEIGRREEIARLRALAGGRPAAWVMHNLAETLPCPTPLTWNVIREFMGGRGGYGRLYRELGYRPGREFDRDGFLELICGRIYVDPRRAAGVFWGDLPLEYDLDAVRGDPRTLERAPTKLNVDRLDGWFVFRLPRLLWAMWRGAGRQRRLRGAARQRFERQALPPFETFLQQARAADLRALSDLEVFAEFERRRTRVMTDFAAETLVPGFLGGLAHEELRDWLTRLLGAAEGERLTRALTSGLDDDITVEQNLLLQRVARGEADLAEFWRRFGHRAVNEMELAQPRWSEEPEFIERQLESARRGGLDAAARHAAQAETRRQAEAELRALLPKMGGASLREPILARLAEAQDLLPFRELGKYHLMRGYALLREALEELARRWRAGRDLYFLTLAELQTACAEGFDAARRVIPARKLRWTSAQKLAPPELIDARQLDGLGLPELVERTEGGAHWQGRAIAGGVALGAARVVLDPRRAGDLGDNYILVCPSTDPGWTPLFLHAKGLIVERGGVLSHGAIVARDFGIPAVVLPGATRLIPPGAHLELDGHQGRVVQLHPRGMDE